MRDLGRRGFLKMMGVGAAAGPLAVKAATEAEATSLMALGRPNGTPPLAGVGCAPATGGPSDMTAEYIKQKAWSELRGGRVPDHIEEYLRGSTKLVTHLDPDIAGKRSWSLAAKIHEQRKRNYEREIAHMRNPGRFDIAQEVFEKVTGFRWRIW